MKLNALPEEEKATGTQSYVIVKDGAPEKKTKRRRNPKDTERIKAKQV